MGLKTSHGRLLLLSACDPLAEERDDLRDARERWQDAELDTYAYVLEWQCFCLRMGRYQITVENDVVVSAVRLDEWEEGPPPELTIDSLFVLLENALDREPDEASLRFHRLGYPTDVSFDPIENGIDDEWGFAVEEFAEGGF